MTEEQESKYYSTEKALELANEAGIGCTLATLISWVERNKLGFQPGGNGAKWFIYKDKFDAFLTGDLKHGKNENK